MSIPIKGIVKYIMSVYKPYDIRIAKSIMDGKPQTELYLYFKHIDEKYLKNPYSRRPVSNKENNLKLSIRYEIESFFTIKTTGLTILDNHPHLTGTMPFVVNDLLIEVISDERKYE